jgi:hypothetical protein
VDGGRDVLQLAAARTLDAVPAHRYEMALRVGDLEAGSWGRIHSAFEGLDCFLWHRRQLRRFGWRRSFGNVVAAVLGLKVGSIFSCMLDKSGGEIARFWRSRW